MQQRRRAHRIEVPFEQAGDGVDGSGRAPTRWGSARWPGGASRRDRRRGRRLPARCPRRAPGAPPELHQALRRARRVPSAAPSRQGPQTPRPSRMIAAAAVTTVATPFATVERVAMTDHFAGARRRHSASHRFVVAELRSASVPDRRPQGGGEIRIASGPARPAHGRGRPRSYSQRNALQRAAVEGVVERGDQLVDGDLAAAVAIHRGADGDGLACRGRSRRRGSSRRRSPDRRRRSRRRRR